MRATLRLSSPAWLAQPKITSSTASQSTPALRAISARSGIGAEFVGPHRGQRAAIAADRRANVVADERFDHDAPHRSRLALRIMLRAMMICWICVVPS